MTFPLPRVETNLLTGDGKDEYTGCPEYKVCAVRLKKATGEGPAAANGRTGGAGRRRLSPQPALT